MRFSESSNFTFFKPICHHFFPLFLNPSPLNVLTHFMEGPRARRRRTVWSIKWKNLLVSSSANGPRPKITRTHNTLQSFCVFFQTHKSDAIFCIYKSGKYFKICGYYQLILMLLSNLVNNHIPPSFG